MEGQENIQEILSKQLLLCQFLTALSTLRTGEEPLCSVVEYFHVRRSVRVHFICLKSISTSAGGHFVCKTFDLFTPFSVGLVYLLYLCFERVSLFKPVTSRPANSER